MDSVRSKARMNAEDDDDDRLSMLPDDLIHKILSFISIKHAVQTSVLSSRWRFIWTSMPYLNISTGDFSAFRYFFEFVRHVMSGRNNQIEVYSVKFTFHETLGFGFHETFSKALLKQILEYAFSHNLQQLTVTCLLDKKIDLPLYVFRSSSLKYLRLTGCSIMFFRDPHSLILVSTWELPALTTLHLDYVEFYDDSLFSKCANLKNLTLDNFIILKSNPFTLSPQISNLTLKDGYWAFKLVNVVAPQLENLTIRSRYGKHLITVTAPNLSSLLFSGSGSCLLQFSTDLRSLEKADLCIYPTDTWNGCIVAALLQQLCNVKFLTLNLEFFQPLISYIEEISLQPSLFSNLRSLKIYPFYVLSDDNSHMKVNMTSKVLNYLLDGSPSATFTLISYEEIIEKMQKAQAQANANAVEAQKLMVNFQVLLEKEKADIETNTTRRRRKKSHEENSTDEENDTDDQDKALVEKMQLHLKMKMTQMKRCCEDVSARIDQGKRTTRFIISQLREIEVLLLKDLPVSKRDELQARFTTLCAEVDSFIKKIHHHMMIPQIQLSDCFNEFATLSLSSS